MNPRIRIIAAILMAAFGGLTIYLLVYKDMKFVTYVYLGALLIYLMIAHQLTKKKDKDV